MITYKDPTIIENFLPDLMFFSLKNYLIQKDKIKENFDDSFGRYAFNDFFINDHFNFITDIARKTFGSNTLLPSYAMFAHYEGQNASLFTHIDDNACTYTLDMCIYQTEPWALVVNGKEYILQENQALAYYGNAQEHGRPKFPNPESQHVAMIFFHFVEPDHWWFSKGPSYVDVIRNNISEEEWLIKNANK